MPNRNIEFKKPIKIFLIKFFFQKYIAFKESLNEIAVLG